MNNTKIYFKKGINLIDFYSNNSCLDINNGGVYFIKNNNNNSIKVGKSTNIYNRMKTLYSTFKHIGEINPNLELKAVILCKDFNKLEKYLHKILEQHNRKITNEWFLLSDSEIKQIVNRINIDKFNKQENKEIINTCILKYPLIENSLYISRFSDEKYNYINISGHNYITPYLLIDIFGDISSKILKIYNIINKIQQNIKEYKPYIICDNNLYIDNSFIATFLSCYVCDIYTELGINNIVYNSLNRAIGKYINVEDIIKLLK